MGKRTVHLIPADMHANFSTAMVKLDIDTPELEGIPSTLWAKSKYDVGFIKGVQPVEIMPKSDFRSCRPQHPL